MSLHSNISPSAAERWTNCPGSVALCAAAPKQKSSLAAAEGTACHGLGEKLLKKELTRAQLSAMEGQTVKVENFDIEVTEEMIDAAFLYADTIEEEVKGLQRAGKAAPVVLEVEKKVVAKSIDEHVYGTSDAVVYQKGNVLIIDDLKYGKGHVVEVDDNKQLAIYAIAVMDSIAGWVFDKVKIGVIQPRARHADGPVRYWETTPAHLKKLAAELKVAVAATRAPDAKFEAGSHCRWCSGKAQCPVMFGAVQKQAAVDFGDATVPAVAASLKDVKTMTVAEMATALIWDEAISAWFDSIRERAKEMLSNGQDFPGFKLVEGKSNRKWIDERKVAQDFGGLFEVYEKKILSPAKLEKIVGKGKLDAYTFKPEASKTLARVSDPRPATKTSAQDDFGPLLSDKSAGDDLAGLM